jgi:hypothetical protein
MGRESVERGKGLSALDETGDDKERGVRTAR